MRFAPQTQQRLETELVARWRAAARPPRSPAEGRYVDDPAIGLSRVAAVGHPTFATKLKVACALLAELAHPRCSSRIYVTDEGLEIERRYRSMVPEWPVPSAHQLAGSVHYAA